ncbi:hypothetical protein [Liquorilactobacillus vini]|uniref:hypothetical protein n=1 Tax=Liquorilactobacillus vini TaxID=238015 RepID=UPI0002E92EC0|nr:hypothetical protein [Liquorilactobacillus vini]
MRKKIIKIIFFALGIGAGYSFLPYFWLLIGWQTNVWINNALVNMLFGLLIMWLISLIATDPVEVLIKN